MIWTTENSDLNLLAAGGAALEAEIRTGSGYVLWPSCAEVRSSRSAASSSTRPFPRATPRRSARAFDRSWNAASSWGSLICANPIARTSRTRVRCETFTTGTSRSWTRSSSAWPRRCAARHGRRGTAGDRETPAAPFVAAMNPLPRHEDDLS